MRIAQIIAVAWLALVYMIATGHAEKRVALVIGNDRYTNLPAHEQLQKAVNDARAVGGALESIGFEVISGENLGRGALLSKLDELRQRLTPGDTAFFFFSGHGVALDGVNYILAADVPDVAAGQETRLKGEALGEQSIISDLTGRGVRVAVVVLDACRTNPFGRSGGKGLGGDKGLAPPPQVKGVFSLYAASNGQAARDRLSDDDRNPNSVFSRVLVPALTRPGLDLTALAFDVREEVARVAQTAGYVQEPTYYDGTIGGRVYLAGLPAANTGGRGGGALPPPAGPAADEIAWSILKDTKDPDQLRSFIAQYPASLRRREAEARLRTMDQMAAVAPPVAPAVPPADPCSGPVTASFPSRCAAPLTAAQERGLQPNDSFKECADCPEMAVVPAGEFTMGSPESEGGRYSDEGPRHIVTISRPFAVGKLHVTVDQFAAFVRETRYEKSRSCSWRNPGFVQEGSHPVLCVSFDDARAYVDWLAKKTRKPYRLLSEAEWEYAARGQTAPGFYPRFWFGNDERELCQYGNGGTNSPCNDGYKNTSPAGHFQPNPFGLHDMFGNAWQWTADCWHDSYNGAPANGSAWTTACQEGGRVARGGTWYSDPRYLRAAVRNKNTAEDASHGFRLARTLTP